MATIGFDWPFSFIWLLVGGSFLLVSLFLHGRSLYKAAPKPEFFTLIGARLIFICLLIFLIARPFFERMKPDPSSIRMACLLDLSGSMHLRDRSDSFRRIDQARSHLDIDVADAWINGIGESYGLIQRYGFAGDELFALRQNSWSVPELGKSTALGDALLKLADEEHPVPLAGVVLFSDGRNNHGSVSPLDAGERFRELGIPINVIGVGQKGERGNVSIRFLDPPAQSKAKEDLFLVAEVANQFKKSQSICVRLFEDDRVLETLDITMGSEETRAIRFSPFTPEGQGKRNFRVLIDPLSGDEDPADDVDVRVIVVRPPDLFSVLYLSNQIRPLYPFLKRALGGDRFQVSAIVRLGEKTFHSRGGNLPSEGYPKDPDFWMQYDVVLLDLECLPELNATQVDSLNPYVRKRGGGLLFFGFPSGARELLGGVLPGTKFEDLRPKQSLSLEVLPDPLFTDRKRVDGWKTFLPGGTHSSLVSKKNPAALGVVGLKGNRDLSALVLQAYGSGKSAYWGSMQDWKRALADEDRAKEFIVFWQALVEWLGSGSVERARLPSLEKPIPRGKSMDLEIEILGADFEPSLDAMVEANVSGPDGYIRKLQLYPGSGRAGLYAGLFKPPFSGSYKITYDVRFPDGEKLREVGYIRVGESSRESIDLRYAERDLKMLASTSGGEFLSISDLTKDWIPRLSDSLPMVSRRDDLASSWPLALVLFLAGGMEWIWRRKGGLR